MGVFLLFRDKRGQFHFLNLSQVVRITVKDDTVCFYGADGFVHDFDRDDVPLEALFNFLKPSVPVGGDSDADRDQNP
jgi:hypothetical protein